MDSSAEIIWRDSAKEDVRGILQYLSRSSLRFAEEWSELLNHKIDLLLTFPEMGRLVFGKRFDFFREVPIGNYRLMYIYLNNRITIVAVRHMAAQIENLQ
jgi:toxin ParE1/3/4